jgi:hypothetical protein
MLRHMQTSDYSHLCIARHTIQFIWNISSQQNSIGLLGSKSGVSIDYTTTIPILEPNATSPISKQWEKEHITLCGMFYCQALDTKQMQSNEELLKADFNLCANIPFIHLHIIFDTKGCLQSEAWILEHQQAVKVPLLLLEDGQPQQKS